MKLHIIGSSSAGNCYILQAEDNSSLIIEGGVNLKEVKKALKFDISKVCGIIISHEHGDHAKYAKDYLKSGIKVYATKGTLEQIGCNINNSVSYDFEKKIGIFKILPFKVIHDASEPCGYLINHPECGNVFFATDTHYLPNRYLGLNNIIVEANYSKEILSNRLNKGDINISVYNRVLSSHMEINTTLNFIKANDLSKITNIVLIHLSDSNSNEAEFKTSVENLIGKLVYVAKKGMVINFNKGL